MGVRGTLSALIPTTYGMPSWRFGPRLVQTTHPKMTTEMGETTTPEGPLTEAFLNRWFPHKDIGWKDLGETFIRYDILKTRWFNIYVHKVMCPLPPPECHDHPWSFVAMILSGSYYEYTEKTGLVLREPFQPMYRPHSWSHRVHTPLSWSIVITGPHKYAWSKKGCHG